MDFKKLFRPHIYNLKPYSSARDEYSGKEGVFLDANENPYGSVAEGDFNRYPDPYQREIKEKLGKLKRVDTGQIFLGNGSDEPIDLIIKATCEPNESEMIIMPPTYGMYQVCADIQQAVVVKANLTPDFEIDQKAVETAISPKTKLIWICSPNNPSGNSLDQTVMLDMIQKYPEILFIIDEAYGDFSTEESMISRIAKFQNIMVLQTFSKAWGMAGLRVGVAYAHTELIAILNKIKYPYNLNIATQGYVLKALDNVDAMYEFVSRISENRDLLAQEIIKLRATEKVFPSDSNQLLVKFRNAKALFQKLLENKIIVRDRSNVTLCEDCLRISVGTKEENSILIEALKRLSE